MHQRALLSGGWARGGASEVVRRACPASGAQWNVQVVRGKVNGKCLWNACKALSLGLLLMILGAAMATIGYYANHLSMAHEVRGNHTIRIKNESRGFHLNNLSYAGPIVMGVGGFIVVAACVMTFEARDSAAKVVPARFKQSTTSNGPSSGGGFYSNLAKHPLPGYGPFLTAAFQPDANFLSFHRCCQQPDRRALTESFLSFSKSLSMKSDNAKLLKVPQGLNKSPSAPNLVLEPLPGDGRSKHLSAILQSSHDSEGKQRTGKRQTFSNCALLNAGMLHRHALSVDEATANYRMSVDSMQRDGDSENSLALDLHLEYPITLQIYDRRRNPLIRQKKVEEDEKQQNLPGPSSRRSSFTSKGSKHFNPSSKIGSGGSVNQIPRRSSNASVSKSYKTTQVRHPRREKLERALSYDARLLQSTPTRHNRQCSPNRKSGNSSSDTDIRNSYPVVYFKNTN